MKMPRNNFVRLVLVLAVLGCGYFTIRLIVGDTIGGPMNVARAGHTATLLPNGKVLVVGGHDASAELYDPATEMWTKTGSLNNGGDVISATLLLNGNVLAVINVGKAELYDPATGMWTKTSSVNDVGGVCTTTLLPNGKVLVLGDVGKAELYDPATGKWTATGSMTDERYHATATLLLNGKVLVIGGESPALSEQLPVPSGYVGKYGNDFLASTELYDPATGTWTASDWLNEARAFHTAVLLPSGKVLLVAGGSSMEDTEADVEIFDPATGKSTSAGSLACAYSLDEHQPAILLPNGKVLVVLGSKAELYDPSTGIWTVTGKLNTSHSGATASLLPNGKVLVAGGRGFPQQTFSEKFLEFIAPIVNRMGGNIAPPQEDYVPLASTELYDPATETWTSSK